VATILELAAYAELPAETVLRVLLREPTNESAQKRVAAAVEALGMPDYPRPDGHVEVLPAEGETLALAAAPEAPTALPAHLDLPSAAGDGHELATELRSLFEVLLERIDRNRRERIDDLALTVDLTTEGWRMVDRRLGRLEKIVERLSREDYFERRQLDRAEVRNLDDMRRKKPDVGA
jgi:hypothetical protein